MGQLDVDLCLQKQYILDFCCPEVRISPGDSGGVESVLGRQQPNKYKLSHGEKS